MFREAYKKAYDNIKIEYNWQEKIIERMEERQTRRCAGVILKPVAAAVLAICLMHMTVIPVIAKNIPAVYGIVERYAPFLRDFILPAEESCTESGITMQVEAVKAEGDNAQVIISFSDADNSENDLIHSAVDMYDSYDITTYGVKSADFVVGGCSFLEYDAAEDKAYFKVDVTGGIDGTKGKKLVVKVRELLTENDKERKELDLADIIYEPQMQRVSLNGCGGALPVEEMNRIIEAGEGDPFWAANVLDLGQPDNTMTDKITLTGIAYVDGILRVQTCRGNLDEADRHAEIFLADEDGNERREDFSLAWIVRTEEGNIHYDEKLFIVDDEELADSQLYGIFYTTGGCVKGNWSVTVNLP